MMIKNFKKKPGPASHSSTGCPSIAIVNLTAGSPAAPRWRPPIITTTALSRRRTRAEIGPRCGPALRSRDIPEVSGVSDHPSSANQPGVAMRYQVAATGRRPPKAGRDAIGQANDVASRRLAGSISARSLRIGSARNHSGSTWPSFQYFSASSHSRRGGAAS